MNVWKRLIVFRLYHMDVKECEVVRPIIHY
jgi:hypothetical protein